MGRRRRGPSGRVLGSHRVWEVEGEVVVVEFDMVLKVVEVKA